MADQITVNYEVLTQIQTKFTQLASDVEDTGRGIGEKALALGEDGWQGRGSDAFYSEMNDSVAPGIRKLKEALGQAAEVVGKISQTYIEADESARNGFTVNQ
jgi:WXG100 family type VII secretion target